MNYAGGMAENERGLMRLMADLLVKYTDGYVEEEGDEGRAVCIIQAVLSSLMGINMAYMERLLNRGENNRYLDEVFEFTEQLVFDDITSFTELTWPKPKLAFSGDPNVRH